MLESLQSQGSLILKKTKHHQAEPGDVGPQSQLVWRPEAGVVKVLSGLPGEFKSETVYQIKKKKVKMVRDIT